MNTLAKTKETQLVIDLHFNDSSIRVTISPKGIKNIDLLGKKFPSKEKDTPLFFGGINYPAASCRVSLRASLFCGMTPRSKTAGYSDRKIKIKELEKDFRDYFSGRTVKFNYPLDIEEYTLFEKKVWKAASLIPHGEVRTYKWVAEKIRVPKGYRAVGNALGKNPVPIIIPCHRVIASNGALGGFSGGIGWKKKLLAIEKT